MPDFFRIRSPLGTLLQYRPKLSDLRITARGRTWFFSTMNTPAFALRAGGVRHDIPFSSASRITMRDSASGVGKGVRVLYSGFHLAGKKLPIAIDTLVWIEFATDDVHFELQVMGDAEGDILEVRWPQNIEFEHETPESYSVATVMQGILIPAGWKNSIVQYENGRYNSRDAYMPWWGQVHQDAGYMCIAETCMDAAYHILHIPDCSTEMYNSWLPSLGTMTYRRSAMFTFFGACDHTMFCKRYRRYVQEKGRFCHLDEKIARNPKVGWLIGNPVIHTYILNHIVPDSKYYDPQNPESNHQMVSFSERARQLRALRERGIERAHVHLDGWGRRGYDNLYPDLFPPCGEAGGAEGMRELAETCKELGYLLTLHDQYRDYYLDADTYDPEQSIQDEDGNLPGDSIWFGGRQTLLCPAVAPFYVRRNYLELERLGIGIQGSYLDVFSAISPDECYHPTHRMSRTLCREKRIECFEFLRSRGLVVSSEETIDAYVSVLDTCHHAPYAVGPNLGSGYANGVPVPLFSLVYHDSIVVPWLATLNRQKGGWGIPVTDWSFLYALLNGGSIYLDLDSSDDDIALGRIALELHRRVATLEMTRHEFVDGNHRLQRSIFQDGTIVEIDLDKDTFRIEYPKGDESPC